MQVVQQDPIPIGGPVHTWEQAGRKLGCSTRYVQRLVKMGRGAPTVPVGDYGTRRLFTKCDLEQLARAIGRELREEEPASVA